MTDHEPKTGILSSLKYTNILLTIIALTLILSVICMHASKGKHCSKTKKSMIGGASKQQCPVPAQDAAPAK